MIFSRYDSVEDPDCYPGSFVLKNRAGLQKQEDLDAFETTMVSIRSAEAMPAGQCDAHHYRLIHHHLFQDIYDWSGNYRTVRTAKNGSMFCYPEHIADQMELLFASISQGVFLGGAATSEFVSASANFLSELNAIHPFREGNGRTQLSFLFLLGERAGHSLDMTRVRAGPMLAAMIASFQGKLELLVEEIGWLL